MTAVLKRLVTRDANGLRWHQGDRLEEPWPLPGQPVRSFRWTHDQLHFPGWYYCATVDDYVGYESLLEKKCLTLLDFDDEIVAIYSQPFRFDMDVDGKRRSNVVDYLVIDRRGGWTLVNVKRPEAAKDPKVASLFAALTNVVERYDVRHVVWTKPENPVFFDNVHRLSQWRDARRFVAFDYEAELGRVKGVRTIGEAEAATSADGPAARALVRHMLWRHDIETDLRMRLGKKSPVLQGGRP